MAGNGMSGKSPRTDADKKASGTFDPRYSEDRVLERKAAKVISGPWLSEIPKPDFPLDDLGMRKYNEVTKALLDQNRLTLVTREHAQMIALNHMQISQALSRGQRVPTISMAQMERSLKLLGIAENAKNIGPAPKASEKKWGVAGFASRRLPKV